MNPSDHFFSRKKGSKHKKRKSYISKAEKRLNSHPSRCGIFKPARDKARGWFHQVVPASEGPSRHVELAGGPATSIGTGWLMPGGREQLGTMVPAHAAARCRAERRRSTAVSKPSRRRSLRWCARTGRDTAGHGSSQGRTQLLLSFKKMRLCRDLPPVQQNIAPGRSSCLLRVMLQPPDSLAGSPGGSLGPPLLAPVAAASSRMQKPEQDALARAKAIAQPVQKPLLTLLTATVIQSAIRSGATTGKEHQRHVDICAKQNVFRRGNSTPARLSPSLGQNSRSKQCVTRAGTRNIAIVPRAAPDRRRGTMRAQRHLAALKPTGHESGQRWGSLQNFPFPFSF